MRLALPLLLCLCAAADQFTTTPQDRRKLAGDTRVGVVVDRQGNAMVRPVARQRWTPLRQKSLILPGDQVRTSPRGANAVEIQLATGALVLGPGSLIEVAERGKVRIYRGEMELRPTKAKSIDVTGPGGFVEKVRAKTVLRARDKRTVRLAKAPRWLSGYHASTTDEWLGSLVAKVDGRDVPLSVGYHKVDVDIRDQIARTTVEQSFVNSTAARLEGVFYFPLPADASISGFGMWIGGEYVEADIVEKQRAREIFEDILRQRRDPGLLEWTGGNMFKARVFPIEAHSEKRIRIRYTQVLPQSGKKIRYRYALRSELLRSRPLRELRLKVSVSSAVPITAVSSPTHEVRVTKTQQTAVAEFDAQEYTPARDFELAIEVAPSQAVTIIPHRRGEDGYFMLRLSPPVSGGGGALERQLTAEHGRLNLVLLADTSGSMDPAARATQAAFIAALLDLLSEKDRFQLLTCDLDVHAFRAGGAPVTEANRSAALEFLAARDSLGWTDLDLAFREALRRARPGKGLGDCHVIYVGDGIGTTKDADPVALAKRLARLGRDSKVTCHAVSTSSAFEKGVLEAVAAIGGGSIRAADDRALETAYTLLAEVAQPTIKNLRVRFEGVRTARVYPETLPNLPAATQQVVLGRYLPTDREQTGRAVITGTLDGKPVRYTAEVALPAKDAGNSFIPRLWARRHLDALLAQGRSASVKEEIVAFSQEFGIMTPYTSLLVLENDADRERYGVERRVHMRDGERFFADGRDRARTELLRQQMKRARMWRTNLRMQMLREIAGLGRELVGWNYAYGRSHGGRGDRKRGNHPWGEKAGFGDEGREGDDLMADPQDMDGLVRSVEKPQADNEELPALEMAVEQQKESKDRREAYPVSSPAPAAKMSLDSLRRVPGKSQYWQRGAGLKQDARGWLHGGDKIERAQRYSSRGLYWLNTSSFQFPTLPAPPKEPGGPKGPKTVVEPDWPQEVLAALRKIDRAKMWQQLEGGLEVLLQQESSHSLRDFPIHYYRSHNLLSARSWLSRNASLGGQVIEHWCDGESRGAVASAFRLGRRRASSGSEHLRRPMPVPHYSAQDLIRRYRGYEAFVDSSAEASLVIRFERKAPNNHRFVMRIDPRRGAILATTNTYNGKVTSKTTYSDFVQVKGRWWPTRVDTRNAQGRRTNSQRLSIKAVGAAEFHKRMRKALDGYRDVIFLVRPEPKVEDARQAVHDKRGKFDDYLVRMMHHCKTQQWDKAWKAFEEMELRAGHKPGARWMRMMLLSWSRRGADVVKLVEQLTPVVVAVEDHWNALCLAQHLTNTAQSVMQTGEVRALHEKLRPIYHRAGATRRWARHRWLTRQASLLQNERRSAAALALRERIVEEYPGDVQSLFAYLRAVRSTGNIEKALSIAERALEMREQLTEWETDQVFQNLSDMLWNRRALDRLGRVLVRWMEEKPKQVTVYQRYLSTLMFLNREKQADAWITARFAETIGDKPDPAQNARMRAAIQMALGRGWHFYSHRMDPRWAKPLAELAHRLAGGKPATMHLASTILSNYQFQQTDEYQKLRRKLARELRAEGTIEEMDASRLGIYLNWLDWRRTHVDQKFWRHVTDRVIAKYDAAEKDPQRQLLASQALRLLDQHGETLEAIGFLRHRLDRESEALRPGVASQLFSRLPGQPWTGALETELFGLVPMMQATKARQDQRRRLAAQSIRQLAAGLFAMRVKHLLGPAEARERLPRAELRLRVRKARRDARAALVKSFDAVAAKADALSRPWFEIERLCFAVQIGVEPRAIDGEARELLFSLHTNDKDKNNDKDKDKDKNQNQNTIDDSMSRVLRERCALVLAYGATRRKAPASLADGVLALIRASQKSHPELLDWRYQMFRLLVALDRVDELEKELRQWIVPAKVDSRWRVALGYLLAETDRIDEAIQVFERVAKVNELGPNEYEVLANWYLVNSDDENRGRAMRARYQTMPEHVLANRLSREARKISRTHRGNGTEDAVPQDLDPDVMLVLEVLLKKASYPANYLSQVNNLYRTVKDFRLLACMVDGAVGQTPQKVYPYLQQVVHIVNNVHEEATCDELFARIKKHRGEARQPVDLRALHLIEAMVLRRASEVKNQPGQHIGKVLAAMQKAFKGSWADGEPRLMAQYLVSLGRIPHKQLENEQLRQLRALDRLPQLAAWDSLEISRYLARGLWNYQRHDEAIDRMTSAWAAYWKAKGVVGSEANSFFQTLVSWMQSRKRFLAVESAVQTELSRQKVRSQRVWLNQLLFDNYIRCLEQKGSVAIGSGPSLYRFARGRIEKSLFKTGNDQVYNLLHKFLRLHQVAARLRFPGVGADLQRFADTRLDELITLDSGNGPSMVSNVATRIRDLNGPIPALQLLVRRLEKEPAWLRRMSRSGWGTFGHSVARYRHEARHLGALEPRLLKIVLRELEQDLTSMQARNRTIYQVHNSYFWKQRQPEFERTAHEVIAAHADSPARVLYAARYLWSGLRLYNKAIDVLLAAELRGKLREAGRNELVGWLHNRNRFKESIPILTKLIALWPDKIHYRISMIRALHKTSQDPAAVAMLDETEKRFKKHNTWNESVLSQLAAICLRCAFYERSAVYYEELIPLHQRTHKNRGVGTGTLSRYYGQLAQAYGGLNQPDKAVDAAAAAVVAWGPTHGNRRAALVSLKSVVAGIRNLDGYAARWNKRIQETGLDAPLIRKTIGMVYLDRRRPKPAILHLSLARDLTAADPQIDKALIKAFDMAGDARAACAALVRAIQRTPMDLDLYQSLGQRLDRVGDVQQAERAWTTLVEVQPNEAESHRRLAQHRERQRRFKQAVVQWRQVVRIRTKEPAGWLALAEAQMRAGDHAAARKTLQHVMDTNWDRRFGGVRHRAMRLINQMGAGRPGR